MDSYLMRAIPILITSILLFSCSSEDRSSFNAIVSGNSLETVEPRKEIFEVLIGGKPVGTAFAVENILLTNDHVFSIHRYCKLIENIECGKLTVKNSYRTIDITDRYLSSNAYLDYAAFSLPEDFPSLKVCLSHPKVGQSIHVMGYSDQDFLKGDGSIVKMDLKRLKKPSIAYDANTKPGMSGSPVFSDEDCVLGLHWGTQNNLNEAIYIHMILEDLNENL